MLMSMMATMLAVILLGLLVQHIHMMPQTLELSLNNPASPNAITYRTNPHRIVLKRRLVRADKKLMHTTIEVAPNDHP